jgi:hypothetical protein
MVSTSFIEKNAINDLEKILLATGRVDPHINANDNQISWDGDLYFYDSPKKFGTKDCAGRIPIQVKGTNKKSVAKDEKLKHTVSVADLRNYKKDGGCMYFVVYCSDSATQIFYISLLPYDLELLFKNKIKNQKKIVLYFDAFPDEHETICAIMRQFLSEKQRQVSTAEKTFDILNPKEFTPLLAKDIEEFSFCTLGSKNNLYENMFRLPTYIYADTSCGLRIPVQKVHIESLSIGDTEMDVFLDGNLRYTKIKLTEYKNRHTITIGEGIEISIPLSKRSQPLECSIQFKEEGLLSQRIKDYEFWRDLWSIPKAHISCKGLLEMYMNDTMPTETLMAIEKRLNLLELIDKTLNYFRVNVELNVDELSEEDYSYFNLLCRASNDEEISILNVDQGPIYFVKIANLNIALCAENLPSGKVKFSNFFEPINIHYIRKCGEETYEASIYLILKKKSINEYSNINFDTIYQSITAVNIVPPYLDEVNSLLLEAICAYDAKPSDGLMNFIQNLSEWLVERDPIDIYQINQLQIVKRQRALNNHELKLLNTIKSEANADIIKIGASILLESFLEARTFWDGLNDVDKKNILSQGSFPIFNLWKQHKSDAVSAMI